MWETRATGVYATDFELSDGTDSVRVAIDEQVAGPDEQGLELELGAFDLDRFFASGVRADDVLCAPSNFSVETTVPPDTEPPAHIAAFVDGESGVAEQTDSITNVIDVGTAHNERRYYEGTIAPVDEVYLLGEAAATDDATYPLGPDDVVIEAPADGDAPLILSDRPEEELLADIGTYRWAYAAAALIGAVGVGLVVYGLGLV